MKSNGRINHTAVAFCLLCFLVWALNPQCEQMVKLPSLLVHKEQVSMSTRITYNTCLLHLLWSSLPITLDKGRRKWKHPCWWQQLQLEDEMSYILRQEPITMFVYSNFGIENPYITYTQFNDAEQIGARNNWDIISTSGKMVKSCCVWGCWVTRVEKVSGF